MKGGAMLILYLQAPFAVFRTFTAGSFRPTAEFITYSAAYGLILNLSGIEMRQVDEERPMTLIKKGLPKFQIALAALSFPSVQSIYQQLHNYPVGAEGKERIKETKGSKYNIAPVRRAFLSDLRAYICLDRNESIEKHVRAGLQGTAERSYGLPFLGDNNFLLDKIEPVKEIKDAYWIIPAKEEENMGGLKTKIMHLTVNIDRADMSNTHSKLFMPVERPTAKIPDEAWVEVGY